MIIKFNNKIYSKLTIKRAIKDYSHLAEFELRQSKDYFLVKITNATTELKDVFQDEFSNYVLSLQKK